MAGYIGTQAVSVNTTSATISDDLSVGDDLTVTDDATIGGTLGVTGVLTGTSLDISGDIDVDGTTNLDVVNAVGAFSVTGTRAGDFLAKITSSNTFGLLVKTTSTSASHEQVQFVDANDSVLFKVLGNGAATIKNGLALTDGNLTVAAGHGIDFAAQTPTSASGASTVAEILDHYEDGSFTPAITDNSGRAGTQSIQVGRYIRVGRLVHVQGRVSISNLASMGGNIILIGLPFTSLNLSNCFSSLNIGQGANLNITAGFSVCGNFSTNSTAMEIQLYDSTAGSTAMTTGEFSADGDIIFSGSYIAN